MATLGRLQSAQSLWGISEMHLRETDLRDKTHGSTPATSVWESTIYVKNGLIKAKIKMI